MLHIRIDLVPLGVEERRQTLTDLYVGNDGLGNHRTGHYDVYTEDPRGQNYPRSSRRGYVGRIENFPRSWGRDQLALAALDLLREKRAEEVAA